MASANLDEIASQKCLMWLLEGDSHRFCISLALSPVPPSRLTFCVPSLEAWEIGSDACQEISLSHEAASNEIANTRGKGTQDITHRQEQLDVESIMLDLTTCEHQGR